jgi:hypothetical protein
LKDAARNVFLSAAPQIPLGDATGDALRLPQGGWLCSPYEV